MLDEMNLRAASRRAPRRQRLAGPASRVARHGPAWAAARLVVQPPGLSLLVGAAAWEGVGRLWDIPFLPPLTTVLRAAAELIASGEIVGFLAASLTSLALGYVLAAVSGISLGLLMGRYSTIDQMIDPYLTAFLAAPKLVFIPPLYAIFGVSRAVQIAVVFLSAFFIVVINTRGGLRRVDDDSVDMARLFGASEWQVFWKVLLPSALPLTLAGLRLAVGRGIKGMVRGEMFIAVFGIGAMLRKYGSRFDAEHVFAIILVVVAVALILSLIFKTIESRLIHWTESGA
jgi:NitT/TauT family transport system permease protein